MKTLALLSATLISGASMSSAATLLFADNFDAPDSGSFDGSDITGRLSGSVSGLTALQSFGAQQAITSNHLDMVGAGGVRFGPETSRFNWASGSTGTDILAAGGLTVTFDWIHNGTDPEWIAWKIGTPNGDTNVNQGSVDHSILIRQGINGVGEYNERWDNGANQGYSGVSHNPNVGVETTYSVILNYSFTSFADGSPVNLSAIVNGIEVVNDNFTWDGNGGALYMELGSGTTNNIVDNLTVTTLDVVPEPTGVSLCGLAGALFLLRRRRNG